MEKEDKDDDTDQPRLDQRSDFQDEARREGERFFGQMKIDVARTLANAGPTLARHLTDSSTRVSLQVRKALIELADVRRKILRPSEYRPTTDEGTPSRRLTRAQGSIFDVAKVRRAVLESAPEERIVQVAQRSDEKMADLLLEGMRPSVNVLSRGLTDPRKRARLDSLLFLELLEDEAKPAASAIIRAMHDPYPFVRWAAARTVGKIRPPDEENATPPLPDKAVPALAALLKDPDIDLRLAAARTLELYGTKAARAIDALIYSLKVGDPDIRRAAMQTLLAIGPTAHKAIPALIALLSNDEAQLRQAAAETLGRFGPAARSALPALRKLLRDSDVEVRKAASEAVLNIEGK
jgi:hypothetical protein